jgi:integrase
MLQVYPDLPSGGDTVVTRGKRAMPKLTKRIVDAAEPRAERFVVWDAVLKGFGLLVLPSGVKSYVFDYRTAEARKRRITIGKHGAWTVEQARKKAEDYRQLVRAGEDPLGAKQALRASLTVGDVFDAYLASPDFSEKTVVTQTNDRRRIESHLRPLIGKRHVHLLTEQDVKRAIADIRSRKHGRGGEGAAKMCLANLKSIISWAIRMRMITDDPCKHLHVGSYKVRETIIDDADAYARMFKALDRLEACAKMRPTTADAIRLIALTGCRRGEAIGLRWRHVELKRRRLVLPAAAHKTGRKTGATRVIGLPAAAQAIIARQPAGEPDDLVFRPTHGGQVISLQDAWVLVRTEAELPDDLTLHGLRHSVASHMAMNGAQVAEIMTTLGHRQLSTLCARFAIYPADP